jgi:hypothetical protein
MPQAKVARQGQKSSVDSRCSSSLHIRESGDLALDSTRMVSLRTRNVDHRAGAVGSTLSIQGVLANPRLGRFGQGSPEQGGSVQATACCKQRDLWPFSRCRAPPHTDRVTGARLAEGPQQADFGSSANRAALVTVHEGSTGFPRRRGPFVPPHENQSVDKAEQCE